MREWHVKNSDNILLEERVATREAGEVKLKMSKISLSSRELVYLASEGSKAHEVPGHSAVAYVSEADEDSGLPLGARVVVSPFVSVYERGKQGIKTLGVDVDGLLRDFVCVPQENVFPLPDGISDEEAVFTDYIAIGNKALESIECNDGDYILIVGANTLGLILSQLASYYQLVPVLVDLDSDKLTLAKSWGVTYTLNPTYDNLERRVTELTGGRMCDAALFAGEGVSLDAAIRLLKDGGEIILGGYSFHEKHSVDMDTILKKQLKLRGISNGYGEVSTSINLLANKIIRTDGLISGNVDFEDVPSAITDCVRYPYKFTHMLVSVQ